MQFGLKSREPSRVNAAASRRARHPMLSAATLKCVSQLTAVPATARLYQSGELCGALYDVDADWPAYAARAQIWPSAGLEVVREDLRSQAYRTRLYLRDEFCLS